MSNKFSQNKRIKILLHDFGAYPFIFDLVKELNKYNFLDIYYSYSKNSGNPNAKFIEDVGTINIHGIYSLYNKTNFFRRFFDDIKFGLKHRQLIKKISPDIIISANNPLIPQFLIFLLAKRKNIKFIFWQQDIISYAIKSVISKRNKLVGILIYNFFFFIEKKILRESDEVITISSELADKIKGWGIKSIIIPNWATIENIPRLPKKNTFSIKHGFDKTFNIIYSGTLGFKHNPELIYQMAESFIENEKVRIIVITEGQGADYLKQRQQKKFLKNLIILPFQKWEIFPHVLASADLLLTILEEDASLFSVPSKVWSTFCAGKPAVLVMSPENSAAVVTKNINAGIVIDDYKYETVVKEINFLMKNPAKLEEMGLNARRYAEENFHIEKVAQKFIKIIEHVS